MTSSATATTSLGVLQEVFGYDAFRGEQAEIIDQVVGGGDAVVLMPTGGGKSLCYQIPALLREGTGVVVSPLIALMADQVAALEAVGIRAAYLNSTLEPYEAQEVERQLLAGDIDLLYMAPERLILPRTVELLKRAPIALFAIDEAHCVSQWGHDFRPDYMGLSVLADAFPDVPRMALTATATRATHQEITERLRMENARHFVSNFDRPNIQYRIESKDRAKDQLLRLIQSEHGGGGHRLLHVPQERGVHRRVALGPRCHSPDVPRGARRRSAPGHPDAVPAGGGNRRRRHDRVRHGH